MGLGSTRSNIGEDAGRRERYLTTASNDAAYPFTAPGRLFEYTVHTPTVSVTCPLSTIKYSSVCGLGGTSTFIEL